MSRQLISYVGLVVLFALSFLVLHRIYGYVIVIQSESNDCFFMFGRQFLMGFFDRPGAPLCYAGRFLGQFYYHTWLGALVVCLCVASFGVLFHRVLSKRKTNVHVSLTLIPCFLLLVLHTSTIWLVQDTLGLCASCGAFLGYLSFRGKVSRRVSALVATPIIYLLLGVYALFFVAWVVIFELNDKPLRSGLLFGIAYVVFCIAVPLIAWRWVFPMPLLSALLWPVTFIWPSRGGLLHCSTANIVMDCVLAIMFCASVFLIPYCGRLPWKPPVPSRWRARARRWQRVGPAIAFVILVILLHSIRYDTRLSTLVTCRQLYKNEQWDALLAEVKKCPSTSVDLQFMTNFALCKKRRLLDEMFHYPQMWGTRGLVLNFSTLGELKPADDDIYCTLGITLRGQSGPGRASTICDGRGCEAERPGIFSPAFLGKLNVAGPHARDDGPRCPKDDHCGHSIATFPRPNNITRPTCKPIGSSANIQCSTTHCELVVRPLPKLL